MALLRTYMSFLVILHVKEVYISRNPRADSAISIEFHCEKVLAKNQGFKLVTLVSSSMFAYKTREFSARIQQSFWSHQNDLVHPDSVRDSCKFVTPKNSFQSELTPFFSCLQSLRLLDNLLNHRNRKFSREVAMWLNVATTMFQGTTLPTRLLTIPSCLSPV